VELAEALVYDYRSAALGAADRALCDFAVKLTLAPGAMVAADVDALRRHGFDDDAITIATQVIAYFNYINRVADGLGVDDEKGMAPPRAEWHRRRGRGYASVIRAEAE
jgi:uncharacterized peroxidase-related enzyme